jgi:hypothetical protein
MTDPSADMARGREGAQALIEGLWLIVLVTIPVTSTPVMARLIGEQQVTPLAGIPFLLMAILWFIPYLIRNGRISALGYPLLLFVSFALMSSIQSLFLRILPAWGFTLPEQVIPGLVTLIFGTVVYFIFSHYVRSEVHLRRTLRWLYLGAVISLLWSSVQSYHVLRGGNPSRLVQEIHAWISIRRLHRTRLVGLTYEPSWLANQLIVLYIPLWVASVAKRFSVYRIRRGWLTFELVFLLWSLPIFFLTYSRIGLISLFSSLGLLVLGGAWGMAGRFQARMRIRDENSIWAAFVSNDFFFRIVIMLSLIVALGLVMLLVVYLASKADRRIQQIFNTNYLALLAEAEAPVVAFARRLKFAERIVYWVAAFRVFSLYPWLGVGLGNVGFFFDKTVLPIGYRLPEIISILGGDLAFPNAKNLWIRLLAETGVIGFMSFVVWLLVLIMAARQLLRKAEGLLAVIGLAGLLALTAQLFEGFSVDSFALPQLWIIPGLVTAALSIAARGGGSDESG